MTALGPLPPLAHTLRIKLSGQVKNHPWASIQHAQYSGAAPDVASLTTLATSIGTAWANAIAPVTSPDTALDLVEVTDLSSATAAQGNSAALHPGTLPQDTALPASACWVQSLKTIYRFRGGHPRIYWPAGDQLALVNGSQFSVNYQTLINTACTGWISDINNLLLNGQPLAHGCAFYYTHDPVTKARMYRDPPLFYPTISTAAHKRIDTQRRRLGVEVP